MNRKPSAAANTQSQVNFAQQYAASADLTSPKNLGSKKQSFKTRAPSGSATSNQQLGRLYSQLNSLLATKKEILNQDPSAKELNSKASKQTVLDAPRQRNLTKGANLVTG